MANQSKFRLLNLKVEKSNSICTHFLNGFSLKTASSSLPSPSYMPVSRSFNLELGRSSLTRLVVVDSTLVITTSESEECLLSLSCSNFSSSS